MAERDSVHEDANKYVNEIEQRKIHDLDELIHLNTLSPHMQTKMEEAFDEEINRLYVEGQDHEEERDHQENIKRWLNGENPWGDEDYPDR